MRDVLIPRCRMEVGWGDALSEETQGLDVLGIRGLDQSLETALANGITTISLRGRYFTLLPWLIGEFFEAEKNAGATAFAEDRLRTFIGRVEYLTLACTIMDDSGGNPRGALGSVTFRDAMTELLSGATIPFPENHVGSILGTYFGPCRAIGLVKTESSTAQPFSLTPRGVKVWEVRKATLGDGLREMLWHSDTLSPDNVRAAVPHFSLQGLKRAEAEAACLRVSLESPWTPTGVGTAVARAYEKFASTVAWLREEAQSRPLRADTLLTDNYRHTVQLGVGGQGVRTAWAEFEWRRRLHFALELMFSAVCFTLRNRGEATLGEIVTEWENTPELPSILTKFWPEAALVWERTRAETVGSVPSDAYLEAGPTDALNNISPHAKAIASFGLVTVLANQSRVLRAAREFPDRSGVGERALAVVEGITDEPFQKSLNRLTQIVVEAHLATTFRKMAGGQKCSLRFFPDGHRLCTTGLHAGAGQSGTRLWNIITVLADAGANGIANVA
jgi:hypothetical protein